jgi:hypothetical protein
MQEVSSHSLLVLRSKDASDGTILYVNTRYNRGYTPILITAALSVAVLVAVAGMQLGKVFTTPKPTDASQRELAEPREYVAIDDADKNGTPDWQDELLRAGLAATSTATSSFISASSSDPVSGLGTALLQALTSGYLSLKEYDAYTPERGERLARSLANSVRAPETFAPHTIEELSLDPGNSVERAIRYRADMRIALEPLISDEEYELTLYASYMETHDQAFLDRLAKAAERYRAAEENVLAMSAPQSAASEHLRLANALGAYAETLDRMTRFANDSFASVALLTAYNEKERDIHLAFDALVKYYARAITNN